MLQRLTVLSVLALSWAAAAGADDKQSQTEWYAVLADGKKIGYSSVERTVADGKVTTRTSLFLTIARGTTPIVSKTVEEVVETTDGKFISFHTISDSPGQSKQEVSGKLTDGKIACEIDSGGVKTQKEVAWPAGAMTMAEGMRLAVAKTKLKEGTVLEFKTIMFDSQKIFDGKLKIGPEEEVDLIGGKDRLVRVEMAIGDKSGTIDQVSHITQEIVAKKVTMSVMGMTLAMVACDEAYAKSKDEAVDFLAKTMLDSPIRMDKRRMRTATYKLACADKCVLPETDNQTVTGSGDKTVVTVRPAVANGKGLTLGYDGKDEKVLEMLKPSRYIQSDDEGVVELSRKLRGGMKNPVEVAWRMQQGVAQYIKNKTLSVGYASAAEVIKSRSGDCTEHAVLLAAVCRAAGLPARVALGFAYADQFAGRSKVFVPHAWTEVYIDGKWYGLDAALLGFGADHITIAVGNGDPGDYMSLTNIMGHIKIVGIEVEQAATTSAPAASATSKPASAPAGKP